MVVSLSIVVLSTSAPTSHLPAYSSARALALAHQAVRAMMTRPLARRHGRCMSIPPRIPGGPRARGAWSMDFSAPADQRGAAPAAVADLTGTGGTGTKRADDRRRRAPAAFPRGPAFRGGPGRPPSL